MKKIFIITLLFLSLFLVGCSNKFYLEDKYYGGNGLEEIDSEEFEKLVSDKESFALLIYQPLCAASTEFRKLLEDYTVSNHVKFYAMTFQNVKESSLYEEVKYYPSFAIIKDGKVVDYLNPDDDKDTPYYKNIDDFNEWFTSYVEIKDVQHNDVAETSNNNESNPNIEVELDNVSYSKDKINIYFFWGNGCSHCQREHNFFDSIEEEYGKYYNLHTFEVWYSEDNEEILKQFAGKMGDKIEGVPYTIIGNKSFVGFDENKKDDFIEAITSQYKNSYDVYFDK